MFSKISKEKVKKLIENKKANEVKIPLEYLRNATAAKMD